MEKHILLGKNRVPKAPCSALLPVVCAQRAPASTTTASGASTSNATPHPAAAPRRGARAGAPAAAAAEGGAGAGGRAPGPAPRNGQGRPGEAAAGAVRLVPLRSPHPGAHPGKVRHQTSSSVVCSSSLFRWTRGWCSRFWRGGGDRQAPSRGACCGFLRAPSPLLLPFD